MEISCAVCRRHEAVTLEDAGLKLYRCSFCGHVFKAVPKEEQEAYGDDYFTDEHKNWFNNPDYPLFRLIHRKIRELKGGSRLTVLDVGCGNGNFLRYLKERDPMLDLYGIDIAENNAPGITFFKSDVMKEPPGMTFDVVTNLAVIEHVDSPHDFAARMRQLLKPGGILFTVTDNDGGMIYATARACRRFGMKAAYDRLYSTHHLQCFSNESLKRLFEMGGFDLIMLKNRNHPVSAVDYPKSSFVMAQLYAAAVRVIFFVSGLSNSGIMQIAVSQKKEKGGVGDGA